MNVGTSGHGSEHNSHKPRWKCPVVNAGKFCFNPFEVVGKFNFAPVENYTKFHFILIQNVPKLLFDPIQSTIVAPIQNQTKFLSEIVHFG